MAKAKGSKKVLCPTCGKALFLVQGQKKTCACGTDVIRTDESSAPEAVAAQ